MPNMQNKKTPMPELPPCERITCFDEVAKGYSETEALNEAERCLNCKNKPCVPRRSTYSRIYFSDS